MRCGNSHSPVIVFGFVFGKHAGRPEEFSFFFVVALIVSLHFDERGRECICDYSFNNVCTQLSKRGLSIMTRKSSKSRKYLKETK